MLSEEGFWGKNSVMRLKQVDHAGKGEKSFASFLIYIPLDRKSQKSTQKRTQKSNRAIKKVLKKVMKLKKGLKKVNSLKKALKK